MAYHLDFRQEQIDREPCPRRRRDQAPAPARDPFFRYLPAALARPSQQPTEDRQRQRHVEGYREGARITEDSGPAAPEHSRFNVHIGSHLFRAQSRRQLRAHGRGAYQRQDLRVGNLQARPPTICLGRRVSGHAVAAHGVKVPGSGATLAEDVQANGTSPVVHRGQPGGINR